MYCTVGTPRPSRVLAVMLCKLEERCMQCKQARLLRIGELAKLGNLFPFFLVYYYYYTDGCGSKCEEAE